MDFQTALASLAQQHPSTPVVLEVYRVDDCGPFPHWEATVVIKLPDSEEEPIVAEGAGETAEEALEDLHSQLNAAPIR